jgi:hypothetical protein
MRLMALAHPSLLGGNKDIPILSEMDIMLQFEDYLTRKQSFLHPSQMPLPAPLNLFVPGCGLR